jgi:zinc protease
MKLFSIKSPLARNRLFHLALAVFRVLAVAVMAGGSPAFAQTASPQLSSAQTSVEKPQPATGPTSSFPIAHPPAGAVWPWDGSDLAPEPDMVTGVLPNGLRYAIRVNKLPLEAVSIRMSIDAGSRHETDAEQGFAHLLEHMAFNGSQNISEGEMTKLMERLGASFGADVNAHTSYQETQYKLDLPRAADVRLDTALKIMRETASRLLLKDDAVSREIGVVKAEASGRDTPGARIGQKAMEFYRPDDRVTKRQPIGKMEIVAGATGAKLRAFYETWYRPERTTLVIAGDVDVAETKRLIETHFADWVAKSPTAPPEPDNGFWPPATLRAKVIVEPDIPTALTIHAARPDETDYGDLDTRAKRKWSIINAVGADVFRRRLATLQLVDDPPASSLGFSQSSSKNGWSASLWLVPRGEDWERSLKAIAVELRQALADGFNQAEIDEAIKESRVGYDRAVASAPTRRTTGFSSAMISSLVSDSVSTTPEASKALFEEAVAGLTPAQVSSAFAWYWQGIEPALVMMRKDEVPGLETRLTEAWRAAMTSELPRRNPYQRATFVPPQPGPPGRLISVEERKAPDATIARFENGVTLAFKKTTYSQDNVSISVRFGAGQLAFPLDDLFWTVFASSAWSGDGVGALTRDQMITALAGRSTTMGSAGVGEETTGLGASPRREDLKEQMQVLLAQVLEPRLGPRAPNLYRDLIAKGWEAARLTASSWFSFNAETLYLEGSKKFELPTLESILASNDELARARLKEILAKAPLNVTIVGNLDFETARDAVAQTFGALPKREGLDAGYQQARNWRPRPPNPTPRVLRHKGPQTQAIVHYAWQFPSNPTARQRRALMILGDVVQLRLTEKVREAEGEAYSPSASTSSMSEIPLSSLSVFASVRPEAVLKVETWVEEIVRDLARTGPTADELKRAVDPAVEARGRARQSNGYWVGQLASYGLERGPGEIRGDFLSTQATYEADLQALKPADIQRLAARYLDPAKAIRVQVLPETVAANDNAAKPETPAAGTTRPVS